MSAVSFYCDGVLVDSETHSRDAWVAVLHGYGYSVGIDDVAACTGMGFRATHGRLTIGPETFEDATQAVEGLAFLPAYHWGSRRRAREIDPPMMLAASGVDRRFSVMVAGDEGERPKPVPDVYLAAATLLRTSPRICVAVEDQPLGATAVVAAGMRVVARDPADAGPPLVSGAALVDSTDAATHQSFPS